MAPELAVALGPVLGELSDPETEDVAFNRPGEGWRLARGRWERFDAPAMTLRRLQGVAVMAAAGSRQSVNARTPLLSCDIPTGHRLQVVMAPAVPQGTISLTFRRPSDEVAPVAGLAARYDTSRWNRWAERDKAGAAGASALLDRFDAGDIEGFLRGLAETRRSPLFAGATGAGKSFLLKSYSTLLPFDARVLTIENALEAVIRQLNNVRMIYSNTGTAGVPQKELVKSALRMRPTYILLGEMLDSDAAYTYCNEGMTGHPGAPSTLHGETAGKAARRLFSLVKGSDEGRAMADDAVIGMLRDCVDAIVPVSSTGGVRAINEVWYADDARRRGETFADLLAAA